MRDIKFRTWDKELKMMIYDKEQTGHIEYETNPVDTINSILNYDDYGYVYMQYTGVRDKNNVDIYEGDTVSYYPFKSEVGKVYYDEAETTYFIEPFDEDGEYEVLGLQCGIEITGNIYENPEL